MVDDDFLLFFVVMMDVVEEVLINLVFVVEIMVGFEG